MALLIFYLLLALGVSFFCSISEAVILSVRPSYIAALQHNNRKGAKCLKKLHDNLDRPLAAILTANTIAHTVGAAGVGAQAAAIFGSNYLGVASAILTLLILIVSEIIPKTLGANYWQSLAPMFAVLISGLTRLLFPFVWLSERLTRLLSSTGASAYTFSRDEMAAMAEIGAREGMLEAREQRIVGNLLRLHQLSVRDIMTPRPVVFSVPEAMSVRDFFDNHGSTPFSRIPVFSGDHDNVTGYVLKIDLLIAQTKDQFNKTLSEFRRPFLVFPDTLMSSIIFDRLLHEKSHMALVVDEYGSVQGIVTLEDVVETLIGLEITDELDTTEDMQVLARKRWRERMEAIGVNPDNL